jgi:hypothetical protein
VRTGKGRKSLKERLTIGNGVAKARTQFQQAKGRARPSTEVHSYLMFESRRQAIIAFSGIAVLGVN